MQRLAVAPLALDSVLTKKQFAREKKPEKHVYNLGGPPHPVIVTIMDNRDYIRVLLYSYFTAITGWGVLLMYIM